MALKSAKLVMILFENNLQDAAESNLYIEIILNLLILLPSLLQEHKHLTEVVVL